MRRSRVLFTVVLLVCSGLALAAPDPPTILSGVGYHEGARLRLYVEPDRDLSCVRELRVYGNGDLMGTLRGPQEIRLGTILVDVRDLGNGFQANMVYHFTIRSWDGTHESASSNEIEVVTVWGLLAPVVDLRSRKEPPGTVYHWWTDNGAFAWGVWRGESATQITVLLGFTLTPEFPDSEGSPLGDGNTYFYNVEDF